MEDTVSVTLATVTTPKTLGTVTRQPTLDMAMLPLNAGLSMFRSALKFPCKFLSKSQFLNATKYPRQIVLTPTKKSLTLSVLMCLSKLARMFQSR